MSTKKVKLRKLDGRLNHDQIEPKQCNLKTLPLFQVFDFLFLFIKIFCFVFNLTETNKGYSVSTWAPFLHIIS